MRLGLTAQMLMVLPLLTILAGNAQAATQDEEIVALKAEIRSMAARLQALEGKQVASQTYQPPRISNPAPSAAAWADAIKLKGDFRYRHEAFDIDNRVDRHRQRVRARTELVATLSDTLQVGFGLASGGDDPISTNQTLGDGFSSKSVVLDLAYANWATPIEGLSVTGGKFKNPFHRAGGNGLLWDGDLRPEGAGLAYDKDGMFINAMALFVDEDANGEDAFLIGGQFGVKADIGNGGLTAGVGYYDFTDADRRDVFYDGDPRGNSVNPDGSYATGFELLEGFVEYSFPFEDTELTVFADYVQNLDAGAMDTGYAFGAKAKQNSWQLAWAYQDLEADAVIGTFTDSDFIGGGTDGKGHILQVGYALTRQIGLQGTLFLNERTVGRGTGAMSDEDFRRLMLDISFKY